MRKYLIVMILVVLLTGCSNSEQQDEANTENITYTPTQSEDEAKGDITEAPEDAPGKAVDESVLAEMRTQINSDVNVINELLEKSANGRNNAMASLLGFSDLLDEIGEAAEDAMDAGEALPDKIQACKSEEELTAYQEEFGSYKSNLEENRASVKQAKKAQDIEQLEEELNDMLEIIEEYNEYLSEVI